MLQQDYIAKLLDLEDVIVTNIETTVEDKEDILHVYLELPRKEHTCPCCGQQTDRIHDYRIQVIKDRPLGRTTFLHLRKRRYVCPNCGKRFYEKNHFLSKYRRMTSRMILSIIRAFQKLQPVTEIAREHNISPTTARRYFDFVSHTRPKLPSVLSIDEFKGNADGEKYQCILADPENRKVLDILPNRLEQTLNQYFLNYPDRSCVKYFVIDLNNHFKTVAKTCFPKAMIVADRYHVVRQVIWAMENVRKAEQKHLSSHLRKYFKRSRFLLNKPLKKLTEDEMNSLTLMFELSPRLANAYRLKNEFLEVMHASDSDTGSELLCDWMILAKSQLDYLPEFEKCITAYHNWSQEILNSLDVRWSNGFVEGCNNKTKVLKRVSFGIRNFSRFRNRILYCAPQ